MTQSTRKTYSVDLIARYFLSLARAEEEPDLITNLKLQKLCYYAFGVMSALREENDPPLFEDPIEAWMHGPVIPNLYENFKKYGSSPIPEMESLPYEEFSIFDPKDREVLDDVFEYYGQFSAWRLRNMTHEEQPWKDAYSHRCYYDTIEKNDIREYFSKQKVTTEEYINSYRN
ncbi:Panacea domain-containing protein [Candidatus Liberibacter sp.]|uniref:Panacea domain-containing protein n=1 Tax=Candidatus Liberibacter sp. TaxID=34022 RepID=UPI0015F74B42|nr:type II toxin-antitoxin system antitoxin SocA domain-containing protein [Candidatus Liberibacter sp.]MBA5724626.1 SocA family protein [Candidatus Liberibacter sp.]